jgi:hypothetical protein
VGSDSKNELFWVCAGWRWGVFYWWENSGRRDVRG